VPYLLLMIGCFLLGCRRSAGDAPVVLTLPSSAVGLEAELLAAQLERFEATHPGIRVVRQVTPDAADQRHQMYVQWLNANAGDPDILQLDVVWTPEFAAAGWLLPLDRFRPERGAFFPVTIEANTWNGELFALPWFVDVGMLYWRTDLLARPPDTFAELDSMARFGMREGGLPYGLVWQGARYEGLVTVFLEYLGAFGGRILESDGSVAIDSEAGLRALVAMVEASSPSGIVPRAALAWQEEPVRFAFQTGQAVFMRNWPYASPLLQESGSAVAGRFAVASMPRGNGGSSTATLGGSQLAINARTEHPAEAYALIEYLTQPEQMLERARVAGQYPARLALYRGALNRALAIPSDAALQVIERATTRPVTPVYTELSGILQVHLHRALSGQQAPRAAVAGAATEIRALLRRTGVGSVGADVRR